MTSNCKHCYHEATCKVWNGILTAATEPYIILRNATVSVLATIAIDCKYYSYDEARVKSFVRGA